MECIRNRNVVSMSESYMLQSIESSAERKYEVRSSGYLKMLHCLAHHLYSLVRHSFCMMHYLSFSHYHIVLMSKNSCQIKHHRNNS